MDSPSHVGLGSAEDVWEGGPLSEPGEWDSPALEVQADPLGIHTDVGADTHRQPTANPSEVSQANGDVPYVHTHRDDHDMMDSAPLQDDERARLMDRIGYLEAENEQLRGVIQSERQESAERMHRFTEKQRAIFNHSLQEHKESMQKDADIQLKAERLALLERYTKERVLLQEDMEQFMNYAHAAEKLAQSHPRINGAEVPDVLGIEQLTADATQEATENTQLVPSSSSATATPSLRDSSSVINASLQYRVRIADQTCTDLMRKLVVQELVMCRQRGELSHLGFERHQSAAVQRSALNLEARVAALEKSLAESFQAQTFTEELMDAYFDRCVILEETIRAGQIKELALRRHFRKQISEMMEGYQRKVKLLAKKFLARELKFKEMINAFADENKMRAVLCGRQLHAMVLLSAENKSLNDEVIKLRKALHMSEASASRWKTTESLSKISAHMLGISSEWKQYLKNLQYSPHISADATAASSAIADMGRISAVTDTSQGILEERKRSVHDSGLNTPKQRISSTRQHLRTSPPRSETVRLPAAASGSSSNVPSPDRQPSTSSEVPAGMHDYFQGAAAMRVAGAIHRGSLPAHLDRVPPVVPVGAQSVVSSSSMSQTSTDVQLPLSSDTSTLNSGSARSQSQRSAETVSTVVYTVTDPNPQGADAETQSQRSRIDAEDSAGGVEKDDLGAHSTSEHLELPGAGIMSPRPLRFKRPAAESDRVRADPQVQAALQDAGFRRVMHAEAGSASESPEVAEAVMSRALATAPNLQLVGNDVVLSRDRQLLAVLSWLLLRALPQVPGKQRDPEDKAEWKAMQGMSSLELLQEFGRRSASGVPLALGSSSQVRERHEPAADAGFQMKFSQQLQRVPDHEESEDLDFSNTSESDVQHRVTLSERSVRSGGRRHPRSVSERGDGKKWGNGSVISNATGLASITTQQANLHADNFVRHDPVAPAHSNSDLELLHKKTLSDIRTGDSSYLLGPQIQSPPDNRQRTQELLRRMTTEMAKPDVYLSHDTE